MPTQLQWTPSSMAGACYASAAILRGETLLDGALQESLAPAASALRDWLAAYGVDEQRFFPRLIPLAGSIDNHLMLADVALRKAVGQRETACIESLAHTLSPLQHAVASVHPDCVQRLNATSAAIQAGWLRLGAALMNGVADLTDDLMVVERATVLLCLPTVGGSAAYLPYNAFALEIGNESADEQLPELLRLAWRVAQLNLDLPVYSDRTPRIQQIGSLALIPIVLRAAERMELAACDDATLALAHSQWLEADETAPLDTLLDWWRVYTTSETPWGVALAALDRMAPSATACPCVS